jgi:hypothetical protein
LLDCSDGSVAAAFDIIGLGRVPITAYRGDTPESMNRLPERVETLLANAKQCLVEFQLSDIYAFFNGQTERSMVRCFTARVHLPSLVDALAAVGFFVAGVEPDPTHSQRRRRQPRHRYDKRLISEGCKMVRKGKAASANEAARILAEREGGHSVDPRTIGSRDTFARSLDPHEVPCLDEIS